VRRLVAGMHLPFPSIGHVRKERQGYAWVPAEFSPLKPYWKAPGDSALLPGRGRLPTG
jgi:hypothetical protein